MAEDSTTVKVVKPTPTLSAFISPANSFNGHHISQELLKWAAKRKIKLNDLCGTTNPAIDKSYSNNVQIIPEKQTIAYVNDLLKYDVIVFDLSSSNLANVEYTIKGIKNSKIEKDITIIGITNIGTWQNTPPKYQQPDQEEEPIEDEFMKEVEEEPAVGDTEEKPKKIVAFNDNEFYLRCPANEYLKMNMIDTLLVSCSEVNPKLHTYVICPGVIYGNGEDVLYEYFKRAWLQSPIYSSIIGKGKNVSPMIHIIDLARIVFRIYEKKPKKAYIFAVDKASCTSKASQKSIVEAVSKRIGSQVTKCHSAEELTKNPYLKILQKDLKIFTSKTILEDEKVEQQEVEEGQEPQIKPFEWHCEKGIVENIIKINEEFTSYNKLKPLRLLITGPPGSGKSFYSKIASSYFNVPHITAKDVFDFAMKLEGQDGEDIKASFVDSKKYTEEYGSLTEEEKATKVPPEKYKPRLDEKFMFKALQLLLLSNACRNRGFVLDGYPRTFADCKAIFIVKSEDESAAEVPFEKAKLDLNIFPENVVRINAEDDFLIQRLQKLPECSLTDHWNPADIKRRIKDYREKNDNSDGSHSITDFFQMKGVEIFNISAKIHHKIGTNQIKFYIERVNQ